MLLRPALAAAALLLVPLAAQAIFTPHIVTSSQKISDTAGDLSDPNNPGSNPGGLLADGDRLGGVAPLGLFDGDGVPDLAVGAFRRDLGGTDRGAVFVLTLNADGTVKSRTEIGHGSAGLTLANGDQLGRHLVVLGDVDGDGVTDLAADAAKDDTSGQNAGAVYILFLNADGTLKAFTKIASGVGGGPTLAAGDNFGIGMGTLGDLNGDGVPDLAVGAIGDDTDGTDAGAVYLLTLKGGAGEPNPGEVLGSPVKLTAGVNGFTGPPGGQWFGRDVSLVGDLDGDQRPELAVGTGLSNEGGTRVGEVWLLSLRTVAAGDPAGDVGKVFAETRIGALAGGFPAGQLDADDQFGTAVAPLGDLDGDGIADLAVNTPTDDDGGLDRGAVWLLYLNANGTVKRWDKLSDTRGCFAGGLDDADLLGVRMALLGDLSGDGTLELAASVEGDDDGGTDRGGVYVLSLEQPVVPSLQIVCASLELEIGVNRPNTAVISRRLPAPLPPVSYFGDRSFALQNSPLPFPPASGTLNDPFGAAAVTGDLGYNVGLGAFYALGHSGNNTTLAPIGNPAGPPGCNPWPFGALARISGAGPGLKVNKSLSGALTLTLLGGLVTLPFPLSFMGGPGATGCTAVASLTQRWAGLPWTAGAARVYYRTAAAGNPPPNATATRLGFDSRTPGFAGHVSLVTPMVFQSNVIEDLPSFGRLNLTFVPEPAPLLGLAAGAAFLAFVARRRLRR